jgi:hypothetical protein
MVSNKIERASNRLLEVFSMKYGHNPVEVDLISKKFYKNILNYSKNNKIKYIKCDCGSTVQSSNFKTHIDSDKHIDYFFKKHKDKFFNKKQKQK